MVPRRRPDFFFYLKEKKRVKERATARICVKTHRAAGRRSGKLSRRHGDRKGGTGAPGQNREGGWTGRRRGIHSLHNFYAVGGSSTGAARSRRKSAGKRGEVARAPLFQARCDVAALTSSGYDVVGARIDRRGDVTPTLIRDTDLVAPRSLPLTPARLEPGAPLTNQPRQLYGFVRTDRFAAHTG